ncbi:hypothetical protein LZL87_008506 [Fusarium oxysporum]|nr:hypothetical protein LZL87_008506 [Fusarium oxysporum]
MSLNSNQLDPRQHPLQAIGNSIGAETQGERRNPRVSHMKGANEGPADVIAKVSGAQAGGKREDDGAYFTNNEGIPFPDPAHSKTVGGLPLISDTFLLQKQQTFNRSKNLERMVQPCGSGAFGYFDCTQDVTELTSSYPLCSFPVNCPFMAKSYASLNFDGQMRVDANHAGNKQYAPNSFAHKFRSDVAEAPYQVSDNIASRVSHYWHEAKGLRRVKFPEIQSKYLAQVYNISEDYAQGIYDHLDQSQFEFSKVNELAETAQEWYKEPKFRPGPGSKLSGYPPSSAAYQTMAWFPDAMLGSSAGFHS